MSEIEKILVANRALVLADGHAVDDTGAGMANPPIWPIDRRSNRIFDVTGSRASSTSPALAVYRPQRSVLSDDTYEAVKSIVLDNVIGPGERISMDRLARELGVSPTPIREALARLEAEHLVVKEPLKGYRSTQLLTRAETNELFEMRLLVEPWAAGRAARSPSAELRASLAAEMEGAVDAPVGHRYEDYRAHAAHETRFHGLIVAAAENHRVADVLDGMHVHLHLFRLHYGHDIGMSALDEHRTIAAAIIGAEPDAAETAMRDHLEGSWSRVMPVFDAAGDAKVPTHRLRLAGLGDRSDTTTGDTP